MAKAYFTLAGLLQDVQVDDGRTVQLDLQSIKVDSVEQLTGDYFAEIIPAFVNPHSPAGTGWNPNNCTQTGVYPNSTSIISCDIYGTSLANSYNPFKNTWLVNYSDLPATSSNRGEIVNTISGNVYGLEQFLFGFDNIETPVNDVILGGSSGATTEGAFYLDVDYTQDFEMIIEIQQKDSLGNLISNKIHTYSHIAGNCQFTYNIGDVIAGVDIVNVIDFGSFGVNDNFGELVDGGNGFMYAAPYNGTTITKLDPVTNALTNIGTFPGGGSKYRGGAKAPNGFIYWVPTNENNVLVLDPSNDTFFTIGTVTAGTFKYIGADVGASGIMYGVGALLGTILKVDTNTNTVSEFHSGLPNMQEAIYASNGFTYMFPVSSGNNIIKIDNATDVVSTVGLSPISGANLQQYSTAAESNGFIYFIERTLNPPAPTNVHKLRLSDDAITTFVLTSNDPLTYFSSLITRGNLIYALPLGQVDIVEIDPFNADSDRVVAQAYTTSPAYYFPALSSVNNNIYIFPRNNFPGANSVTELEFIPSPPVITDINSTQVSFLSGGLSGWIVPNCAGAILPKCDAIVSQALGRTASITSITKSVFFDADFIKTCCYFSPVFAHLTDTDDFKNDYNSFVSKKVYTGSSETITMTLLKNGGAAGAGGGIDIPLIDNTYGTYIDFGSYGGAGGGGVFNDYKGYIIDWQKVLQVEGEGTYQFQNEHDTFGVVTTSVSVPFVLKEYSLSRVKGTVRIESVMNGYLKHLDFDYGKFDWKDSVRFRGFFGNNQPEYEEERIIYTNRKAKQLRSEMINNYVLQSMRIPSCITQPILEYHNFANYLLMTDYNPVNHRDDYVTYEVIFDAIESIDYHSVTNNAVLNLKYKDYTQNYTKSNC